MTITNPNLGSSKKGKSKYPVNPTKTPRALFKAKVPRKPKPKPEWKLQAAVVSNFHKMQDAGWKFEFAGDMNAGKRNGSRAKLTGLKAGEPDIRVYLSGGCLKMIELKTGKGVVSDEQKKRHAALKALGFEIAVVYAKTEASAVVQCRMLLDGWMGEGNATRH